MGPGPSLASVSSQPFPFLKKESWVIFLRFFSCGTPSFPSPLPTPCVVCLLQLSGSALEYSFLMDLQDLSLAWARGGVGASKAFIIKENSLSWNWALILLFPFSKRHPPCTPLQLLLLWGPGSLAKVIGLQGTIHYASPQLKMFAEMVATWEEHLGQAGLPFLGIFV